MFPLSTTFIYYELRVPHKFHIEFPTHTISDQNIETRTIGANALAEEIRAAEVRAANFMVKTDSDKVEQFVVDCQKKSEPAVENGREKHVD